MNGVDSFAELIAALTRPTALLELGLLVGCLGLAWLISALLRPKDVAPLPGGEGVALAQAQQGGIWFGRRGFDGALFPMLALALALLAQAAAWALAGQHPGGGVQAGGAGAAEPGADPGVGAGAACGVSDLGAGAGAGAHAELGRCGSPPCCGPPACCR